MDCPAHLWFREQGFEEKMTEIGNTRKGLGGKRDEGDGQEHPVYPRYGEAEELILSRKYMCFAVLKGILGVWSPLAWTDSTRPRQRETPQASGPCQETMSQDRRCEF